MARSSGTMMLALGALLFGAGVGVGMLLSSSQQEPATIVIDRTGTAPVTPPLSDASLPTRLSGPTQPATSEQARLQQLLNERLPPETPTGDGVITGTVLTSDGEPVPGITVLAQPEDGPSTPPRPPGSGPPSLEDDLSSAITRIRHYHGSRRTAVTDAGGAYRLEALPDVNLRVWPQQVGWTFRRTDRHASTWRPGAVVDFTAEPESRVEVKMVMPDGLPPTRRARVLVTTGGSERDHSWSVSWPHLRLRPGTHSLVGVAGEQSEWSSDPISVDLVHGEATEPVTLHLVGKPGIEGRVLFENGEAGGRPMVYLMRRTDDVEPDAAVLRAAGQTVDTDERDAYGYHYNDLEPGDYVIGVSRGQGTPVQAVQPVTLSGSRLKLDLTLPAMDPSEYVAIRVLDHLGRDIGKVRWRTGYYGKNRSGSGGSLVVRREDRMFLVCHNDGSKDVDDATLWAEATVPGRGSRRVEYRPGDTSPITIQFKEAAKVALAVTGDTSKRYAGRLQVALVPVSDDPLAAHHSYRSEAVGVDGRLDLPPAQPGEYELVLKIGDRQGIEIARQRVTLNTGEQSVDLRAPALFRLTVTGVSGRVLLQRKPRSWLHQNADEEKRAVFDGLPAGEWVLHAGGKQKTIELHGDMDVSFP